MSHRLGGYRCWGYSYKYFLTPIMISYLNYRLFRSVLKLSKCKGGMWFVYFLVTNFIFNYIVLGESGLII